MTTHQQTAEMGQKSAGVSALDPTDLPVNHYLPQILHLHVNRVLYHTLQATKKKVVVVHYQCLKCKNVFLNNYSNLVKCSGVTIPLYLQIPPWTAKCQCGHPGACAKASVEMWGCSTAPATSSCMQPTAGKPAPSWRRRGSASLTTAYD